MWLTDLADVARAAGLDVREAPGWQTRGHGPMTDVRTITCHHTGSSGSNDMSLSLLIAGRSDLPGPIANLGLGRSGRVYVVAAGRAYHAGDSRDPSYTNSHAIGIEAQASGVAAWPDVQMDAYARLCRALADHYGLPYSRVLGHKETCAPKGRKVDPNFDMDAFRRRVEEVDDMPTADEIGREVAKALKPLIPTAQEIAQAIVSQPVGRGLGADDPGSVGVALYRIQSEAMRQSNLLAEAALMADSSVTDDPEGRSEHRGNVAKLNVARPWVK